MQREARPITPTHILCVHEHKTERTEEPTSAEEQLGRHIVICRRMRCFMLIRLLLSSCSALAQLMFSFRHWASFTSRNLNSKHTHTHTHHARMAKARLSSLSSGRRCKHNAASPRAALLLTQPAGGAAPPAVPASPDNVLLLYGCKVHFKSFVVFPVTLWQRSVFKSFDCPDCQSSTRSSPPSSRVYNGCCCGV